MLSRHTINANGRHKNEPVTGNGDAVKKFFLFLMLALLFSVNGFASECFDELPGEENIPDNTPEKIKLTKTSKRT